MSIWITSDWHFNHSKDFIYQARGFQTIEEMNAEIVKRHNEIVTSEDEVYVLGDLCMSTDLEGNKKLIESLNGNIRVLFGNHDTGNRIEMYKTCSNVIEICGYATMLKYKKYNFYLSHYPTICQNYSDGKSLKTKTLAIHGHTHDINQFDENNLSIGFNCCLDATNCYPINIETIIEQFKKKVGGS